MSFPSAIVRLEAGDTPEASLLYAMEHDTPLGYAAITAVSDAVKVRTTSVLSFIRERLGEHASDVLRAEWRGEGLVVDFTPLSTLGLQVARLMTDAARSLMRQKVELALGLGNCCKLIASPDEADTHFSIEEQIRWQNSIDC